MADNQVPAGTFNDYSESNADASEKPTVYEVCQKSGFKTKPAELVRQWDGAWVRGDFLDKRHSQEFVRGLRERVLPPSPPEQDDAYISISRIIRTESGRNIAVEEAAGGYVLTEGKQVSAEDL
jgi:hypothetical protein